MGYSERFTEVYENLQKAIKDRTHLTQKVITDKNGHTRKVWVKTEEKKSVKPGKNVADNSSLLPSWTIEEEKTLDADAKSLDNEIKRIKNMSYSEREEHRDLFINHLFNYSYAIKDYANDRTITNDILPSERDFNYDDVSFEQLFNKVDQMNKLVEKLKKDKRTDAKKKKEELDTINKLIQEDTSDDNFITKLHKAETYNRLKQNINNKNFGTMGKTPVEYLQNLENYVIKNGVSSYDKISKEDYLKVIEKLKKEYLITKEDKKIKENTDLNKLPDNFYSYSTETQDNIKKAKYSIVNAKYTSNSGKVTEHKIAVVMQESEFNMFDNPTDVVQQSILYGTYGTGGKKEVVSVQNISPYEFEKITGKKVGDYANKAAERDYSYFSLKNDMVAAIQKEDEDDF